MKDTLKDLAKQLAFFVGIAGIVAALNGCSSVPKAKDMSASGMYMNAATETVAIGKVKITKLPDSLESFVAHYSEDTAWLSPSTKTRFLDIYMTGTNCTAAASNVVDSICRAFVGVVNSQSTLQLETPTPTKTED